MMSRVVVLVSLFLFEIVDAGISGETEERFVNLMVGQPFILNVSVPGKVSNIRIQSDAVDIKVFQLQEAANQEFADINCQNDGSGNSSCTFSFPKMLPHHSGEWKIDTWFWNYHSKLNERQRDTFELIGNKIVNASNLIGDEIHVEEGKYIALHFDERDELRSGIRFKNAKIPKSSCTLFHNSKGREYNLKKLREEEKEIRGFRECGLIMLIKKNSAGFWSIVERFAYEKSLIYFKVIVEKSKKQQISLLSSELGFPLYFPPVRSEISPIPFELERPDGYIISVDAYSYDSFKIDELTNTDAGNWVIRSKSDRTPVLSEEKIIIILHESPRVDTLQLVDGNSINVGITIKHNISYGYRRSYGMRRCQFKKQNRMIFTESEVWTDDIFLNEVCEVRLNKTSADDYGKWEWSIFYKNRVLSGFMMIHRNITSSEILHERFVWQSLQIPKYVKSGNEFEITCVSPVQLKECVIKSPHNITHAETENLRKTSGNCGVDSSSFCGCVLKIDHANFTHNGNWICTMKADSNPPMISTIPIIITDFHLISEVENIEFSDGGNLYNRTVFQCRTYPEMSYKRIENCWWEHNGKKIIDSEKYTMSRSYNKFSLEIRDFNQKDFGDWVCFARLFNDSMGEMNAVVQSTMKDSLQQPGEEQLQFVYLYLVATIAFSVVIIIMIISIFVYCVRKRCKYTGYERVESYETISNNRN